MRKLMKICFIYLVPGLLSLVMCEASPGGEVETSSVGTGIKTFSKANARDLAIEDALKRAVKQAVGTFIDSESIVENYELLSDRIFSKTTGHIKNYKIIREWEEDSQVKVEIRATVGTDNLKNDLEAIGLLMQRKHKPRVMVIADETMADKNILVLENLSVTENVIIGQFFRKGFKVIDADTVKKITKRDQLLSALYGDNMLAAKIGLQYGAEVVVMAQATASSSGYVMRDSNLQSQSIDAIVTARVIRVDNAEIIAEDDAESTKPHISPLKGAHKAFKAAGKKLADSLIEQILAKWSSDTTNLSSVVLVISGLDSHDELRVLKQALSKNVRGLKGIHQRSFIGGVAKLEIDLRGDTQTLVDMLGKQKMGSLWLDIIDSSQNKIQARFRK